MKLSECLTQIKTASTATELEAKFQSAIAVFKARRTDTKIHKTMKQRGLELCSLHPRKELIPRIGSRRRLTLCGKTCGIGFGMNGAGERYVWHLATEYVIETLMAVGIPKQLCEKIWNWAPNYPHRALMLIDQFLELPAI